MRAVRVIYKTHLFCDCITWTRAINLTKFQIRFCFEYYCFVLWQNHYICLQLLLRMHTEFFGAGSLVAGAEEQADRLMIVVTGRVKIYLKGLASRRSGLLLTLGPGYVLSCDFTFVSGSTVLLQKWIQRQNIKNYKALSVLFGSEIWLLIMLCRASIGNNSIFGDPRWAGYYGIGKQLPNYSTAGDEACMLKWWLVTKRFCDGNFVYPLVSAKI